MLFSAHSNVWGKIWASTCLIDQRDLPPMEMEETWGSQIEMLREKRSVTDISVEKINIPYSLLCSPFLLPSNFQLKTDLRKISVSVLHISKLLLGKRWLGRCWEAILFWHLYHLCLKIIQMEIDILPSVNKLLQCQNYVKKCDISFPFIGW